MLPTDKFAAAAGSDWLAPAFGISCKWHGGERVGGRAPRAGVGRPASGEAWPDRLSMTAGVRSRRLRAWTDTRAALKRRFFETLGFCLLLAALLILAALLSYSARDPSLDTAIDTPAHNFIGGNGAIVADLLRQGFGFAAFVIPVTLVGWSLRLLLDRPLQSFWLKLGLLPVAVILASLGLSVLDYGEGSGSVAYGGVLGWEMQRLLAGAGFGSLALPASMTAAAGLGLLLLLILGLSWRDWHQLGSGASRGARRVAAFSGRGTIVAATLRRQSGAAVVASALPRRYRPYSSRDLAEHGCDRIRGTARAAPRSRAFGRARR